MRPPKPIEESLDGIESCKSVDCAKLLMELQYAFPLTSKPYHSVAEKLGYNVVDVLEALRDLKRAGILKRVGFYYNVRSTGRSVALVAFMTSQPEKIVESAAARLEVTHAYVRECDRYNLWVVVRGSSKQSVIEAVESLAARYARDYSILWALRTYRLSVKYDLYRGISRAGYLGEIPLSPPRPEDYGYPSALAKAVRSLPLEERPYAAVAAKFGLSEKELVAIIRRFLEAGILADPGAALDGHRVGFSVNVMYTVKAKHGDYDTLCRLISRKLIEATHIVLREPYPSTSWDYKCFFMVHAVDERVLHTVDNLLYSLDAVEDFLKIKSIRDLMPGIVR